MAGFYVQPKLRPCFVINKEKSTKALFHCWEHFSEVLAPSPMIGGQPGGTFAWVRGIVELEDGQVIAVAPQMIKFVDNACEEYIWQEEKDGNTN